MTAYRCGRVLDHQMQVSMLVTTLPIHDFFFDAGLEVSILREAYIFAAKMGLVCMRALNQNNEGNAAKTKEGSDTRRNIRKELGETSTIKQIQEHHNREPIRK